MSYDIGESIHVNYCCFGAILAIYDIQRNSIELSLLESRFNQITGGYPDANLSYADRLGSVLSYFNRFNNDVYQDYIDYGSGFISSNTPQHFGVVLDRFKADYYGTIGTNRSIIDQVILKTGRIYYQSLLVRE